MKKNYSLLIICFFVSIVGHAAEFIIINKIMYDSPLNEQIAQSIPYSNGEFVELYNAGINSANLSGWTLRGGGTTETYNFPNNTVIAPKSFLVIAFQYANSGFTVDQLYAGFYGSGNNQILYQRKIILSNSGEPVYLKDNQGMLRDSIYYDGTSNKTKPNRLSADNVDGLSGNFCVCLQRKTALFTTNGHAVTDNLEWASAVINPFQLYSSFIQPVLPGEDLGGFGVSYAYDYAGNRISRKLAVLNSSLYHVKRQNTEPEPDAVKDKLGDRTITVYPNPTHGALAIGISGGDLPESTTLILYNAQGAMLQNFHTVEETTAIDMSTYPVGWYIVRVIVDAKTTEFKIIKQ